MSSRLDSKSCFYFISVCCGIKLPNFYDASVRLQPETDSDEKQKLESETETKQFPAETEKSALAVIATGFFFFFLTAGSDAYFQSQTYTFGLCGPLALTPAQVTSYA